MSNHGHRPGQNEKTGPYAFGEDDPHGWSGGAGLWADHSNGHGSQSAVDLGFVNGGLGQWIDENGVTNYGFRGGGGLAHTETSGGGLGADVDFMTANAGLYANKNSASVGAAATGIGGGFTFGSGDHMLRIGLSAGPGAGLRAHYGDNDGNGVRGLGGGVDAGPLSIDWKSESTHGILKYLQGLWD